jgi:hypothetical protein
MRSSLSYEEKQVGALMDFEMVTIREDVSLEVVLSPPFEGRMNCRGIPISCLWSITTACSRVCCQLAPAGQ